MKMAMEVYPTNAGFGVRAEEPEDNSEEDIALALATEECDRARNAGQRKGCLKVETQKLSLSLIYNESLAARKAANGGISNLKHGESLEETGHTCSLSESESSHFSTGGNRAEQSSGQNTVSGESSSEKEMNTRISSSRKSESASLTELRRDPIPEEENTTIEASLGGPEARTLTEARTSTATVSRVPVVKQLAWGRVEIRNYDLTIGDNPACLAGAPIQLSWSFDEKIIVVPVDEYETYRPPRRKQRQLFLNREVRDKMLHEYGFKRTDISQAVRRANIDRNNRKTTVMNMKFTWFYELTEGASRKMKKSICGYNEKKEIDKLWQKAEQLQAKKQQGDS